MSNAQQDRHGKNSPRGGQLVAMKRPEADTLRGTARVILVGDLGGHPEALDEVIRHAGLEDDIVPEDVTVCQVGDLIRVKPGFKRGNDEIAARVDRILERNPPERWRQLLGNHEAAALGGRAKHDWDPSVLSEETKGFVRRHWASGRIEVSWSCGGALITHAGLTHGQWVRLGRPSRSDEASEALNAFVAQPMRKIILPGALLTGTPRDDADVLWAEASTELLPGWLRAGSAPFDQIHGHSGPYRWPSDDWWPAASAEVRSATVLCRESRITRTVLSSGHTLTCIDPIWEDEPPRGDWALLSIRPAAGPVSQLS